MLSSDAMIKTGLKSMRKLHLFHHSKPARQECAEAFCTLDATSVKVTGVEATTQTETYRVDYKET